MAHMQKLKILNSTSLIIKVKRKQREHCTQAFVPNPAFLLKFMDDIKMFFKEGMRTCAPEAVGFCWNIFNKFAKKWEKSVLASL